MNTKRLSVVYNFSILKDAIRWKDLVHLKKRFVEIQAQDCVPTMETFLNFTKPCPHELAICHRNNHGRRGFSMLTCGIGPRIDVLQ